MVTRSLVVFIQVILFSSWSFGASFWGVNSGLESEMISDKVLDLGTQWVRLTVEWHRIEKTKGKFDWTVPDTQWERARARKLNLCMILYGTPSWANGGQPENHPPHRAEDWFNFVKKVAYRYAGSPRVQAFAIWNEPNVKKFWRGSREEYVQKILIPGFNGIRSISKRVLVLAPEMSHHWQDQKEWKLSDIMKSAGDQIDVVTLHYYPDSSTSFVKYLDREVKPYLQGKKLWITEIGEIACSEKKSSESRQKRAYEEFLDAWMSRSEWLTRMFFYRIWDPGDNCENGNGFGLTHGSTLQERQAFHTYRDFIRQGKERFSRETR